MFDDKAALVTDKVCLHLCAVGELGEPSHLEVQCTHTPSLTAQCRVDNELFSGMVLDTRDRH